MSEGWAGFETAVATARAELLAAAPDADTAAAAEAYLMRVVATTLADAFVKEHLSHGGLGRALPVKGAANPDYILWGGGIDPRQTYRLEGRLNGSERVGVGLYALDPAGGTLLTWYAAVDPATTAADGSFGLDLEVPPESRVLVVRVLHRDRSADPARFVLTGGTPPAALTPVTGTVDGALAFAARGLLAGVRQFLEWTRLITAHPNEVTEPPPGIAAVVEGDPATRYLFAAYELAEGQALEVLIPDGLPGYWSLHAYNHWLEALPGAGVHDHVAIPDEDGRIRVRIGAAPASLANRLDAGRRGVLVFRAYDASGAEPPRAVLLV
jgi:hypothetical protein